MKIFFNRFCLKPISALNAVESDHLREGVFLLGKNQNTTTFWEYFPHPGLGDETVDEFLAEFKLANSIFKQKALFRLMNPLELKKNLTFLNHELYRSDSELKSKIIKFKLLNKNDFRFLKLIENGHHIRLDANGIFDRQSWTDFEHNIPKDSFPFIDYIEDPLLDLDWSNIPFKVAQDFISGEPFHVKIYKPYRELFPKVTSPIIFSSSMGHLLSTFQTYLELIHFGDLTLYHGIVTPKLYANIPALFIQTGADQFILNDEIIDSFMKDLLNLKWTHLCTI
jgi:hypothetical protein